MIDFYYNAGPNPMKVALLLEELGVSYNAIPVDTRKGEQFHPNYLKINPNAKAPTIVDDGVIIFDSNAILLYLAEKSNQFLPTETDSARGELLSWLMFIATGVGPYSGQSVHFKHFAPATIEYAINRYDFEAHRHYKILDDRLKEQPYMLGDEYTIVDMAVWGWARLLERVLSKEVLTDMPNLERLMRKIELRPATKSASKLASQHSFKSEMDDEARRNMFPQNERLS